MSKFKNLNKAIKYLESKDVDITSNTEIYTKRALFIAADITEKELEQIQKKIDNEK